MDDDKPKKPMQLNMFLDGDRARDEALERVAENSGEFYPKALALCVLYCRQHAGNYATGETLRHYVCSKIGEPHHRNAWGSVIKGVITYGALWPTGKIVKPLDTASHSSRKMLYLCRSV